MISKNKQELISFLSTWKSRINRYLEEYFIDTGKDFEIIKGAINYSLFSGGKRIRPIITVACSELFGVDGEISLPFGCGIELIHTFSLIHDDLPCMDDDDLRRGKPTSHKVYGEAQAVLAGDALFAEAFHMMSQTSPDSNIDLKTNLEIINFITKAIGVDGMVGGQSLDLLSESKPISLEELEIIHVNKTAKLFEATAFAGAKVGGADDQSLKSVIKYGHAVGYAFQIVDDILDYNDHIENLKSPNPKDGKQKITFPFIIGIDQSKKVALEQVEIAKECLENFGEKATLLNNLADYIVARKM